jgi:TetR/AcrR family transcriptional repressor of nem operon
MLTTPGRPALGRLRAHFEFLAAAVTGNGFTRGCLAGNLVAEMADHSEPIRSALRFGLDEWARLIQQVLTEAQRAGELDPGLDAGAAAVFILSAWQGTLLMVRAGQEAEPFDAFFRMVFGAFLRKSDSPAPSAP